MSKGGECSLITPSLQRTTTSVLSHPLHMIEFCFRLMALFVSTSLCAEKAFFRVETCFSLLHLLIFHNLFQQTPFLLTSYLPFLLFPVIASSSFSFRSFLVSFAFLDFFRNCCYFLFFSVIVPGKHNEELKNNLNKTDRKGHEEENRRRKTIDR